MYGWIIILGIAVFGILIYVSKNKNNFREKESPMQILDRRFANGEITKEQYEEQKQIINSKK